MDQVQDAQFAFRTVHYEDEIQSSVAPIDDSQFLSTLRRVVQEGIELRRVEEIAERCWPGRYEGEDLVDEDLGGPLERRVEPS
jgi:hypothetical protein